MSNLQIIELKNSSDSQIGLRLRPRPILAVLGIFFIQLFPNWTACSPFLLHLQIVEMTVATLLISPVLCGIALRALNDKTTHQFLTAVARNPVSKDAVSQRV